MAFSTKMGSLNSGTVQEKVYLGKTTKVTITFGGVETGPKKTEMSHRPYM